MLQILNSQLMQITMKTHIHSLYPFADNPHHHFYCQRPYCGREFWSAEMLQDKLESMYLSGHEEGLKDAKTPEIVAQYEMIKLTREQHKKEKNGRIES